jgi:predicted metal-dependent phosphoesterase TrpH
LLKADLHIHSQYSMDCDTPLEKIISRCQELSINCIALADHGTTEGAQRLQKIAPFKVIIAEEVLTPEGEIMGMFLKDTIASGQPLDDVIQQIKAQGGLVCAQHPYDTLFRPGLGDKVLARIARQIDLVEVLNARSPSPQSAQKSLAFARRHNLPGGAGSDAHALCEIGNAYVEIPEFTDKESFLDALRQGEIGGHLSGPFVHFSGIGRRIKNGFRKETGKNV